MHRYMSCQIWKYDDEEHGPVIAKVMTKDERQVGIDVIFLQEVDLLSRLRGHPNIVRMVDTYASHDEVALVTQYGGIDLHHLLHKSTVKVEEPYHGWIALLWDLLRGLSYMHQKDVVHADLKPCNVVVDDKNVLRTIDVGISWVDRPGLRPTIHDIECDTAELGGLRFMTPCCRSPEVYLCDPNFGKPMDMWGVGCIVLEMWILKPLVSFKKTSPLEIVKDIFGQCSVQANDALAYFHKLPAWRDSLGKVSYPVPNALGPRLDACQVPAWVRDYICEGLLVVHPLHRMKVWAACHRLSAMRDELEGHS